MVPVARESVTVCFINGIRHSLKLLRIMRFLTCIRPPPLFSFAHVSLRLLSLVIISRTQRGCTARYRRLLYAQAVAEKTRRTIRKELVNIAQMGRIHKSLCEIFRCKYDRKKLGGRNKESIRLLRLLRNRVAQF